MQPAQTACDVPSQERQTLGTWWASDCRDAHQVLRCMPYWCSDCRSYFSVRTNTPIERSASLAACEAVREAGWIGRMS